MRRNPVSAFAVVVGLCMSIAGIAKAEEVNVYWRVDLNQGSYIIAYGQGATEEAAKADCRRLRAITRAMTAAETRKSSVSAITTQAVRWCKNPMQYATVRPDPVAPPPPVDCVVSDWGPPSDPAWLGCTGAQQTRAIIRIRSIATQPANGGAVCPALIDTTTQTRTCALLTWSPPAGTPLASVTGYRIVYGRSPAELVQSVDVGPALREYALPGLVSGQWYFAGRTLAGGNQSAQSSVVTRVIP
jgi:hypothetical protein